MQKKSWMAALASHYEDTRREFNQSTQHLRQRNTFIEAFCG